MINIKNKEVLRSCNLHGTSNNVYIYSYEPNIGMFLPSTLENRTKIRLYTMAYNILKIFTGLPSESKFLRIAYHLVSFLKTESKNNTIYFDQRIAYDYRLQLFALDHTTDNYIGSLFSDSPSIIFTSMTDAIDFLDRFDELTERYSCSGMLSRANYQELIEACFY